MSLGGLRRNALASAAQVLLGGIAVFIAYRLVVREAGMAAMGVWSLVFALTQTGRVADLGLAGSSTRLVARELARGDAQAAAEHVETAALTALAISVVLGGLLMAGGLAILARLNPAAVPQARPLLPLAAVCFIAASTAAVYQAALDGTHRLDLRSAGGIVASLVFLSCVALAVPRAGIRGLAWAQLAQSVTQGVLALLALRRALPSLSLVPHRWSRRAFRELLSFGSRLQLVSLCVLLFEPSTKFLLSRFGDLASVGLYELTSRLVQQVRGLLVGATQALTPAMAHLSTAAPAQLVGLYRSSYRATFFAVLPLMGGLLALGPAVSLVWLGQVSPDFLLFLAVLTVPWAINGLSSPGYFLGLGTGELRWVLTGHMVLAVSNLLLGALAGRAFGALGVVGASAVALLVGSAVTALGPMHDRHIPFAELLPAESRALLLATTVGAVAALAIAAAERAGAYGSAARAALAAGSFGLVVLPVAVRHRIVRELRSPLGQRVAAS